MEEDFSPPIEASLRRTDSNNSWKASQGSSQTTTAEPNLVDPHKLFLVSLQTLVALFAST
jgi:hypothetical protein